MQRFVEMTLVLSFFGLSFAQAQTCPVGNPRTAPDTRYVNHGNGTVTDTKTALMWKQCSEGQSGTDCSSVVAGQSWQTALTAANSSSFAGFSDWRLPSVKELQSLVETGCHSSSINTTLFPNTATTNYWSSTTYAPGAFLAWHVEFDQGIVSWSAKFAAYGVRFVRAGR